MREVSKDNIVEELPTSTWVNKRINSKTSVYTGIIDKQVPVGLSLCIVFHIWLRIYRTDKHMT